MVSRRIALCVFLASGCTLFNDPWSLGGPELPPDAPSAPEIDLAPAAPTGADTLSVSIRTESVDPLGGTVRYEYAWFRDTELVDGLVEPTVTPDFTTKGQRWDVRVVPFATAEGGPEREGPAATASVTIVNSRPVLRSVGLSRYDPIQGEQLRAFAGPVEDADTGDAHSRLYRWRMNGEILNGVTDDRLELDGAVPAGAEITVEVTASDGEDDSDPVIAGPAIVLSSEMRWRQAWPNRDGRVAYRTYDPIHRRILFFDAPLGSTIGPTNPLSFWEYALDGLNARFVQLPLAGDPPGIADISFGGGPSFVDEANERMILVTMIGAEDVTGVFLLDIAQRGNERWSRLNAAGAPPDRVAPVIGWAQSTSTIVVAGGFDSHNGFAPLTDVWLLDLAGTPSWRQVADAIPPGLNMPLVLHDAERNRLLLIAGSRYDAFPGEGEPSDAIYALDLDEPASGFALVREDIGFFTLAGLGYVDRNDSGRAIVLGLGDIGAPEPTLSAMSLDLETLTFAPLNEATIDIDLNGPPLLVPNLEGDGAILVTTSGPLDAHSVDPVSGAVAPLYVHGETGPPPLAGAIGHCSNAFFGPSDFVIFGGETPDSETGGTMPLDRLWRAAQLDTPIVLEPSEPTADATDGLPSARSSVVGNTSGQNSVLSFFSGGSGPGLSSDPLVWTLEGFQWAGQSVTGGTLEAVEGGVLSRTETECLGGATTIAFGGRRGDGSFSDVTVALLCTSVSCTVQPESAVTVPPPARAFAAVSWASEEQRSLVMFGGLGESGPLADLYTINACDTFDSWWTERTPVGTPPSARYGHSMTGIAEINEQLVFGGNENAEFPAPTNDLHRLIEGRLGAFEWVAATPRGVPPFARYDHVAVFDREGRRLLVYGGRTDVDTILGDLWELHLPAVPER